VVARASDAFGTGSSTSLRAALSAQATVGCISEMDFRKFWFYPHSISPCEVLDKSHISILLKTAVSDGGSTDKLIIHGIVFAPIKLIQSTYHIWRV